MTDFSGSGPTALIIGCGIAGPTLAMFLQRAGITPVILEGRPAPADEVGAFLNLAPNGLAVLDLIGVKDAVLAAGTPTTRIAFLNPRGKQLGENPEMTTLIKRGRLNQALRDSALERGVQVEFGKRLVGVETTADGVRARFADGSEVTGDLAVGCDGIHSRTRVSIMPHAPAPRYTGVIDCGAFTRTSTVPPSDGLMQMTFGINGFFGYQVLDDGEVYWFENFTQAQEPDRAELDAVPAEEWRQRLLDMHREDHAPIPEFIASTTGGIGRWPIYDMPTLPSWHVGRVCLIGDAAHATSPHVGQGASMAMEDAAELARCLRDLRDPATAFAAFERRRMDRVEKVVEQARKTGNQKAPASSVGRFFRDLVLPVFLKRGVQETRWVYEHRIDWDERADAPV
jgi:2-polyprenyl-6-methoxyphenol hydroxylase-like FAD-dependent oxidoreductase